MVTIDRWTFYTSGLYDRFYCMYKFVDKQQLMGEDDILSCIWAMYSHVYIPTYAHMYSIVTLLLSTVT